MINRHAEEPVHLRGMQRHREDAVCAGGDDEIRHEARGDRDARRVFLVRSRVRVVRNHGRYPRG